METIKNIIKDHIKYRKQIFKLAKADLVKTYRGSALRLGLGYYQASSNNFCILVCFYNRIKGK